MAASGRAERGTSGNPSPRIPTRPGFYPEPQGFRRELTRAQSIYRTVCRAAAQVYADVRVGRALNVAPLAKPLARMVASVIRHPDAMVWMCRLHPHPANYWVGHAVRSAALAVVLGREMGLAEPQLARLALAGILCQIGKTRLPMKLLQRPGPLAAEDLDRIRNHVRPGSDLLRTAYGLPDGVLEIVASHQERFDGSGWPEARRGERIPALARLLGMVEWYDSMISVKPYTDRVLTPSEAMDYLYQQRDVLFSAQVVEEFVRAVGVYPNGTLVELDTGAIALVQAQNAAHRTQPCILVIRDHRDEDLRRYELIDLAAFNRTSDAGLTIRRTLPADVCAVDLARLTTVGGGGASKRLFCFRMQLRFPELETPSA